VTRPRLTSAGCRRKAARSFSSTFGGACSSIDAADGSLLTHEQEKRLAFHLANFPSTVADAARTRAVNLVAEYASDPVPYKHLTPPTIYAG